MPQFDSLPEAFEWFLENVYPKLPTEKKTPLRSVKYAFYSKDRRVSEKLMRRVLDEHAVYEVKHFLKGKDE
jgi:hypothetical protein